MMWFTVIANVIQLVSAAVEFVSNTLKRRRTTIKLQIVSRVLDTTSDFLLQGFSGMVVDAADAIRNILNYRDQLTPRRQFLLVMATVVLIPFVNNLGIIGLLPLLSTVFFTCTARTRDPYKFNAPATPINSSSSTPSTSFPGWSTTSPSTLTSAWRAISSRLSFAWWPPFASSAAKTKWKNAKPANAN